MIERYKSGFTHPGDLPFEDLSAAATSDTASVNGSTTSIPGSADRKSSILGTITGGRVKKRSGLLGLFANNKVGVAC